MAEWALKGCHLWRQISNAPVKVESDFFLSFLSDYLYYINTYKLVLILNTYAEILYSIDNKASCDITPNILYCCIGIDNLLYFNYIST